jgi:hypothetical protein
MGEEMSDEYRKCVVTPGEGSKLAPCDGLSDLVTQKYRGLGVDMQERVNLETMKPSREVWMIRSGKHAKNGMNMNYCPICGESLRGLFAHLFVAVDETETTP